MPQLNRDILREIFNEIVKSDGSFFNIDKFMMAGKEPFNLVLDICKKAKDVVIFNNTIFAKLPNVEPVLWELHESDWDRDALEYVTGTEIHESMKLFKPISNAVGSTLTSLDIRNSAPALIPMLKTIDQEMDEVNVRDYNRQLKLILEACVNINVRNGVTIDIDFCQNWNFACVIKSFAFRCHKLTMKSALFHSMCQKINFYNYQLRNIRDLTIRGRFERLRGFFEELKDFAAFLSINFPNLENLNVLFSTTKSRRNNFQDLNNVDVMANFFQGLPAGVKGVICFKIINPQLLDFDLTQYPGVQRGYNEYYKIDPITDTLCFKMSYWYNDVQD